jgi:hypothetical protein
MRCLYGLPLTKSGTTYTARSATTIYQGVTIGTDTFAGRHRGVGYAGHLCRAAPGTATPSTSRRRGSYDFRAAGFIGTVVLTATVPGVIVQVAPSVSFDDTDPNVTVDASVGITIANANLIDGSRVQLYNVTQDTELENTTVSGGAGYSYVATLGPGQEVESGDTIRLIAAYRSGATYKENYQETNAASVSGINFLGTQTDWEAANGLGKDGSLETEYMPDDLNIQIDIDSPDQNFDGRGLVAFILHNQTTEDGIRNFFGALKSEDAANWYVEGALVDMKLDNINSYKIYDSSGIRFYKKSAGSVVTPVADPTFGGGDIDINWREKVYVSVVTTSGAEVVDAAEVVADVADAVLNADPSSRASGTVGDTLVKGKVAAQTAAALSA